jgi:hypothetical protein
MPYLYCAADGPGYEQGAAARQDDYREAGEGVLIVHGPLASGPHRCDRCNAALGKGDHATLLSAIPRHVVEGTRSYDFAYEKRYFDMKRARVALYGAPWPAVVSAAVQRSG